ncbi:MAG: DUF1203 domain-containing protein [Ignavibacteriales bacterium]|nr:DUF1203 domain-containing protein [Ignavibacteriales bacterium]
MGNFKYLSIPMGYIEKIRKEMKDDFGHSVEIHIAGETGYGPCRCCLKQFMPGEKRLLFSYAPVGGNNPYNEVGPVYIHEHCLPYATPHEFPIEVKRGRLPIPLVLRCYNNERRMIDAVQVKDNNEVEAVIQGLFNQTEIEFIHIRNGEAQCFIAQVERVN